VYKATNCWKDSENVHKRSDFKKNNKDEDANVITKNNYVLDWNKKIIPESFWLNDYVTIDNLKQRTLKSKG